MQRGDIRHYLVEQPQRQRLRRFDQPRLEDQRYSRWTAEFLRAGHADPDMNLGLRRKRRGSIAVLFYVGRLIPDHSGWRRCDSLARLKTYLLGRLRGGPFLLLGRSAAKRNFPACRSASLRSDPLGKLRAFFNAAI